MPYPARTFAAETRARCLPLLQGPTLYFVVVHVTKRVVVLVTVTTSVEDVSATAKKKPRTAVASCKIED